MRWPGPGVSRSSTGEHLGAEEQHRVHPRRAIGHRLPVAGGVAAGGDRAVTDPPRRAEPERLEGAIANDDAVGVAAEERAAGDRRGVGFDRRDGASASSRRGPAAMVRGDSTW
jgi:hypothetical protein